MKSSVKAFIFGAIGLLVSVIFTFAVKNFDVAPYACTCADGDGGTNTSLACPAPDEEHRVGFATLNENIRKALGYNPILYKLSNLAGLVPIAIAGVYAIYGLGQWIKRKKLFKVEPGLFALGGFLLVILGVYVLFEKLAINFRPVCFDGVFEASFPSSHTVLAICLCFGVVIFNLAFYSREKLARAINLILVFVSAFILVTRLLSGAHWFTDIIGGVLYSISLLLIYTGVILTIKKNTGHKKVDKGLC